MAPCHPRPPDLDTDDIPPDARPRTAVALTRPPSFWHNRLRFSLSSRIVFIRTLCYTALARPPNHASRCREATATDSISYTVDVLALWTLTPDEHPVGVL